MLQLLPRLRRRDGIQINKGEGAAMVPQFINVPRLARDTERVNDKARGKKF